MNNELEILKMEIAFLEDMLERYEFKSRTGVINSRNIVNKLNDLLILLNKFNKQINTDEEILH